MLAGIKIKKINDFSSIDNIRQRFIGYEKDIDTDLNFADARMYENSHNRLTAPN